MWLTGKTKQGRKRLLGKRPGGRISVAKLQAAIEATHAGLAVNDVDGEPLSMAVAALLQPAAEAAFAAECEIQRTSVCPVLWS